MYVQGKVCLSILNTWPDGPQWSGVQTLESVLLVLMSDVLCANPLENEPAYRKCGASEESKKYNRLVWHANIQTAVLGMVRNVPEAFSEFSDIIEKEFQIKAPEIVESLTPYLEFDAKHEHSRAFSFGCTYSFGALKRNIEQLIKN
jgi:hypothetical protein